ncbi:hypothetical protein J3R83DRAFT_1527 [Lanmaoa asiatica]|nr:hypothetical protein J3R83DRAFT_1527 [Lanmaoa asiatica]
MTKAIPVALVLALACLFALSTALPSVLSQTVPAKMESNEPSTLLGKPYRRRWYSQGCPPSGWTIGVADRNDSDPPTTYRRTKLKLAMTIGPN